MIEVGGMAGVCHSPAECVGGSRGAPLSASSSAGDRVGAPLLAFSELHTAGPPPAFTRCLSAQWSPPTAASTGFESASRRYFFRRPYMPVIDALPSALALIMKPAVDPFASFGTPSLSTLSA